jgi:hypothetical protein
MTHHIYGPLWAWAALAIAVVMVLVVVMGVPLGYW